MTLGKASKRILTYAFLIFFSGALFISHQRLMLYETESGQDVTYMFLPKANHIRPFLIGHEAFLADLIWIRTLGYFADELSSHKRYAYLNSLINLATDLDPRFDKIYIWAGAAMMYNSGQISVEKIMMSTKILEKGWKYIQEDTVGWNRDPRYWMIPQMIGFNYAIELNQREKGAPFIVAAAKIPGCPDLYKTWAASLYSRAGKMEQSTEVLEDMLAVETLQGQMEASKEEGVKSLIRERLEGYYHRLYGGDEAEKRMKATEDMLRKIYSRWQTRLPYLPFPMFYILTPPEGEKLQTGESTALWAELFPQ